MEDQGFKHTEEEKTGTWGGIDLEVQILLISDMFCEHGDLAVMSLSQIQGQARPQERLEQCHSGTVVGELCKSEKILKLVGVPLVTVDLNITSIP